MKALSFAGVIALLMVFTAAKSPVDEPGESESRKVAVFDFGNIKMKGKEKQVKKIFKIYNTSKHDLRIKSVCTPCNYTVPVWTKDKIKPGKYGLVMVIYYPEAKGPFEASLQVNYYDQDKFEDENLSTNILVRGSVGKTR